MYTMNTRVAELKVTRVYVVAVPVVLFSLLLSWCFTSRETITLITILGTGCVIQRHYCAYIVLVFSVICSGVSAPDRTSLTAFNSKFVTLKKSHVWRTINGH